MSGRLALSVAAILFVLISVDVNAATCNDSKANTLFVEAANMVWKVESSSGTDGEKIKALEQALKKLHCITTNHKGTLLAVRLSSGEGIGEISIAGLERQIKLLKKVIPHSCRCASLRGALVSALDVEDDDDRDAIIGAIARKQVRRDRFDCARDLIDLIDDEDRAASLRGNIARASARDALKKRGCCSWSWC